MCVGGGRLGSPWAAWLLVLVVAGGAPCPVRAQPVDLSARVDPCVPVDVVEFRRLLTLELGQGVRVVEGQARGQGAAVELDCGMGHVHLQLHDAVTRKVMARDLPLSAFDTDEGARLLALAVAEFVSSSWLELSLQPPTVEPLGPPPPPEVRETATVLARARQTPPESDPDAQRVGASVALGGVGWLSPGAPVEAGPGLRVWGDRVAGPLSWAVGLDFSIGTTRLREGLVEHSMGSAMLAAGVSGSAGPLSASLTAGARVGYLTLAGLPVRVLDLSGAEATRATGGPMLRLTATGTIAAAMAVGIEMETGYVALPVRVTTGDTSLMRFGGVWVRAGLLVRLML